MKCKFCVDEGRTSTLTPSPTIIGTCMATSPGFYDESGAWAKAHDPNWYTRDYWCSNGHRFSVTSRDGDPDEVKLISTATWTIAPLNPDSPPTLIGEIPRFSSGDSLNGR